tara:strand:- start:1293 stop:2051 length:759 start_codon:yes stop_codon:yes gene_type:complete
MIPSKNMDNIPNFFQTLCKAKQIYNATPQDLLFYFPPHDEEHLFIELEKYDCLCIGYQQGIKKCFRFRILKCEDQPLLGRHEILMDGKVFSTDSLTHFKKEILHFEDHVSFDRATFLLLENQKKVFRLNILRSRLSLPLYKGGRSKSSTILPPIPLPETQTPQLHFKINPKDSSNIINYYKESFNHTYDSIQDQFENKEKAQLFFNEIILKVFEKCIHLLYEVESTVSSTSSSIEDELVTLPSDSEWDIDFL